MHTRIEHDDAIVVELEGSSARSVGGNHHEGAQQAAAPPAQNFRNFLNLPAPSLSLSTVLGAAGSAGTACAGSGFFAV